MVMKVYVMFFVFDVMKGCEVGSLEFDIVV